MNVKQRHFADDIFLLRCISFCSNELTNKKFVTWRISSNFSYLQFQVINKMELGVLIIRIVDWLQSFKSNYLSVSTQQFLKPFQCLPLQGNKSNVALWEIIKPWSATNSLKIKIFSRQIHQTQPDFHSWPKYSKDEQINISACYSQVMLCLLFRGDWLGSLHLHKHIITIRKQEKISFPQW